jgi:hypothetical protein
VIRHHKNHNVDLISLIPAKAQVLIPYDLPDNPLGKVKSRIFENYFIGKGLVKTGVPSGNEKFTLIPWLP